MAPRPAGRIPLPLLPHFSAKRSLVTCRYRCGNQCAHEPSNTSSNTYFGDLVERVLTRRGALKAGGVLALTVGGAAALSGTAAAERTRPTGGSGRPVPEPISPRWRRTPKTGWSSPTATGRTW